MLEDSISLLYIIYLFDPITRRKYMHTPTSKQYEIRDPVHTSIPFDAKERAVIDHPFVQRLRRIRQLGFTQYPFPGATHTRFLHSIGVMHLAGGVFDIIFQDRPFSSNTVSQQYRYCLRMAALLHDVGHSAYSHSTEFAMPNVSTVVHNWPTNKKDRQATHEDYTIAIITQTSLAQTITQNFAFTAKHIAALIDTSLEIDDDFFIDQGYNLRPLFSQLISSNLDMDRSDYLVRDSFFTGVKYGQVDISWLHNHLSRTILPDNSVVLGLHRRALYAFDHFLIARYNMFLMVYFHKMATAFELMLEQYMADPECTYRIPHDLDEYLYVDDADTFVHLRKSNHPIAQDIIRQNIYKVVGESHGQHSITLQQQEIALQEAGIPVWSQTVHGSSFSNLKSHQQAIYVLESNLESEGSSPLHSLSSAFDQAKFAVSINRLYVPVHHYDQALKLLSKLDQQGTQQPLL